MTWVNLKRLNTKTKRNIWIPAYWKRLLDMADKVCVSLTNIYFSIHCSKLNNRLRSPLRKTEKNNHSLTGQTVAGPLTPMGPMGLTKRKLIKYWSTCLISSMSRRFYLTVLSMKQRRQSPSVVVRPVVRPVLRPVLRPAALRTQHRAAVRTTAVRVAARPMV
jgi:hypothetical protein